ncbi:hypothetical protein FE257_006251 [Aspergillus nanangensis]|uniref:Xylanolytic transcriptional activator regulatory domain-containing protein n=1 Tax=Aspergillus nanangensis TaxID=2582783 RepID=A0AAD4CP22_ASPNN|nr:hypothetical protein FE257_006251 [Aspergillus nanangensis]
MNPPQKRPRRLFAASAIDAIRIKSSVLAILHVARAPIRAMVTVAGFHRERGKYLKKLEAECSRLARDVQGTSPERQIQPAEEDHGPQSLTLEESNIINPLFDKTAGPADNPGLEPSFLGEASSAAFANRLLQCLDNTKPPPSSIFTHYHRSKTVSRIPNDSEYTLPERIQTKLLLNIAGRFIGADHHLYLRVSFMEELDAVYRKEVKPTVLWLSKLFALLALGEVYSNRRGPGDVVPGVRWYQQALDILQDTYEETSLMQVEVLVMLAWYSNTLGRVRSAHCYNGVAMRLALSLGMHRSSGTQAKLSAVERESRKRTWWVLYFFERMTASKLGQPITIRDEDIDVEMPSMDGLTAQEAEEFVDPAHLCASVRLAKIIGNILTGIYGLPNRVNGMCVQRVHSILNQLRDWDDTLPSQLKSKGVGSSRPVASLHVAYNQCIIQTTRPILLHLVKERLHLAREPRASRASKSSSLTLALAESCINAAKVSCRILEDLFISGAIAIFGYWEAQHIFSSALILMISAMIKPNVATSDSLQTLISILQFMKQEGNIPAANYCEEIRHIQDRIQRAMAESTVESSSLGNSDDIICTSVGDVHVAEAVPGALGTTSHTSGANLDSLTNPLIENFLDENRFDWPDALFAENGSFREFASELEEQFLSLA